MITGIDALNAASDGEAAFALASCCGSSAWVAEMLKRRPFASREELLRCADEAADSLESADWREAFGHHPRIGERTAAVAVSPDASNWSAAEQARAASASDAVRAELARANEEYEQRFGHIFIICANGREADEILGELRVRLGNTPHAELAEAAREQRQITRLRMERLLSARSDR